MITRALLLIALLASLAFYTWGVVQQRDRAEATAALSAEQRDQMIQHANTLATSLSTERTAQQQLRATQDDLRATLRSRQNQIEELKRDNQELRDWAAQPLPDAARRLRERPAITGAGAYREHLSRSGAVPAAAERPP